MLFLAHAATAQELPGLSFEWSAPDGCPTREAVLGEVQRLASPELGSGRAVSARAVVMEHAPDQWQAEVTTSVGALTGQRTLDGENCVAISNAVALVIALTLEPSEPPPEPPPPPPPEKKPPPSVVAPAFEPPPGKPRPDADRFGLRAATGLGSGTLPGIALSGQLHGLFAARTWSAEARLSGWLPKTATSDARPEAGGRFFLLEGGIFACLRPRLAFLRFDTCAGGELAYMTGEGFGIMSAERVGARWGNAVLEQGFAASLSRQLSIRLFGQWSRPFTRPRFVIENLGEVHRPKAFTLRGAIAAELYL